MKRISLQTAALAVAVLICHHSAEAIDPSVTNRNNTNSTVPRANPLDLSNPAATDPFFNAFSPMGNGFGLTSPNSPSFAPSTPVNVGPNGRTRTDLAQPSGAPNELRLGPTYVPPVQNPPNSPRRWRLGVWSKDTETGVRIERIVSGSAADRARLEPEDVIVAVSGYQVGYVNGQLYDCSSEFERHADNEGWVTMLIQNHRDNKLVNVPIQLDPRFQTLKGTLSLNDGRQLPNDAQVSVELREIVAQGAEPVTVASDNVEYRPNQYPIPFQIEYDPASVDTRRNYVVTATVHSANRLVYQTANHYPAFRPGGPQNVAVALSRVSRPQFDPSHGPVDRDSQIAAIVNYFQQYLGRNPRDTELITFLTYLESHNYTLTDIQTDLLSHNQFFNRCNRDKKVYIEQLHQQLVGRPPRPEEMAYWMSYYDNNNGTRRDFTKDFLSAASGVPR